MGLGGRSTITPGSLPVGGEGGRPGKAKTETRYLRNLRLANHAAVCIAGVRHGPKTHTAFTITSRPCHRRRPPGRQPPPRVPVTASLARRLRRRPSLSSAPAVRCGAGDPGSNPSKAGFEPGPGPPLLRPRSDTVVHLASWEVLYVSIYNMLYHTLAMYMPGLGRRLAY